LDNDVISFVRRDKLEIRAFVDWHDIVRIG
jgi:hypothetical protein